MIAMKVRRHGVAAALLIITALLQIGCGTSATSPESLLPRDIPGEVIIPEPAGGGKLSVPVNFKVESLGSCLVVLSWTKPAEPVDAVISLDGVPMTRQPASCACYFDMCGKTPGVHTYQLQYSIGAAMGPVVTRTVTILPPAGGIGEEHPLPEEGLR